MLSDVWFASKAFTRPFAMPSRRMSMNTPQLTEIPVRMVRSRLLRMVWPISRKRSSIGVDNSAVHNPHDAVCGGANGGVVGNNHGGHALGIQLPEYLHHLFGGG